MSGQWTVPAWLVLAAAAAIGVLVVVALAAVLRRHRVDVEATDLRRPTRPCGRARRTQPRTNP